MGAAQARRVALAAQGFAEPRPGALGTRVTRRHFKAVLDRLSAVQIDTVNVLARAHLLTFFARLGPYDQEALGRWLHDSGEVFEYWAHAASFVPADLHPAFRFKMAAALDGEMYSGLARLHRDRPEFVDGVRRAVLEEGPLLPADLRAPGTRKKGQWWDWDDAKRALELLFWAGEITATRGRQFERIYDAFHRVLPAAVLDQPTPSPEESRRTLLRR
ncbi:MAG TPA: crosslink repair DNA glycosylase YcaQ family protein, partial [Acidimicrobiales bacterium]|nr:crosslink repair DNA glycosylase YcaQ family protein [Acidimicrobiales bacterium]